MGSLLPSNATPLDKAIEAVGENILSNIEENLKYITFTPQNTHTNILGYLAYMLDMDISSLDEKSQRIMVQNALEIHRYKGTLYAIKKALEALFDNSIVVEWFDSAKEPYTFDVKIALSSTDIITKEKLIQARNIVNSVKNVRSGFDNFILDMPQAKMEAKFVGAIKWQF